MSQKDENVIFGEMLMDYSSDNETVTMKQQDISYDITAGYAQGNDTFGYHLGVHAVTEEHAVEDYDLSQYPYPMEAMNNVPQWEAIIKIGFCVLIMTIAILGNMGVILTVWKKKRLRSTTNYYIVNLAVSDLLVTISCTWVQVVHNLTEGWQLGAFFCKFNSFSQGILKLL